MHTPVHTVMQGAGTATVSHSTRQPGRSTVRFAHAGDPCRKGGVPQARGTSLATLSAPITPPRARRRAHPVPTGSHGGTRMAKEDLIRAPGNTSDATSGALVHTKDMKD